MNDIFQKNDWDTSVFLARLAFSVSLCKKYFK